jgi:hypothetical protein
MPSSGVANASILAQGFYGMKNIDIACFVPE